MEGEGDGAAAVSGRAGRRRRPKNRGAEGASGTLVQLCRPREDCKEVKLLLGKVLICIVIRTNLRSVF